MKKYEHTKKHWLKWYKQKNELLKKAYTEVTPLEFYKDMFDGVVQSKSDDGSGRGNAMVDVIVYYQNRTILPEKNERQYSRKYIMNDDYAPLKYLKPIRDSREEARLCLCSPCTYYGKHKSNSMAHELVAVALDLDYLGIQQLKNVMKQIGNGSRIMPPNYICNSGRGIHLYYLLKEPIPCYQYMVQHLTKFKAVLQDFIWNETSSLYPDNPDHGAITQAFRMVGSETKLGKDYVVKAYKVREKRWTIEELYAWVYAKAPSFLKNCEMPQLRDPIEVYRKKYPMTMAEAKEKYPDWVPCATKKKWTCKEALYLWWIRQIKTKAIVGGRYYSILALAAYASKCDIPLARVKKDAMELYPHLEELTDDETNHFKKSDIKDALNFYRKNKAEVTYKLTRDRISDLSKIYIKPNKRNYRKQKIHLKIARSILEIMNDDMGMAIQGRPCKEKIVKAWQQAHPNGKKIDCIRDTGLSKPTVLKWWN